MPCYRLLARGLLSLCLFAARAGSLGAQATHGEVTGRVSDAAGRALADVEITATHLETGVVRSSLSEASGIYRISALAPGDYEVRVSTSGFKTVVHRGLAVAVGEAVHLDVTLEAGSANQTVTVTGQAVAVNIEQGRVAELVDAKRIRELPLNGRNIYQLMQLATGAVNFSASVFQEGQNTSVNGVRPANNGFWLDGVT